MPYGYPNTMNFNPNWIYNPAITTTGNTNSSTNWIQNQPIHIAEVHGKEGAQAYVIPPGSSILLLDKTDSVVWLKTTDDGGYPSLSKFYITPAEQVEQIQKENQYDALKDRLTNIENQYAQLQTQYNQIEEKINNGKSYSSSYAKNNSPNSSSK